MRKIIKIQNGFLILLAAAFIGMVLFVAASRITYPFALEWAEGGSLDHIARILQGQPLYGAPSMEFTPFTYPPLYFYLAAALAKCIGLSFLPLRLLSLLSSLGCIVLIYALVHKESKSAMSGLLAATLYAACYPICGSWFDVGRVDNLFLFFLLAALYLFRNGRTFWSMTAAALFLVLSFFTKQTALLISLPLLAYSLLPRQIRLRWAFVVIFLSLLTSGLLVCQWLTNGWFFYYIFYLPRLHALAPAHLHHFILGYMLKPLPVVLTMICAFLLLQFRQGNSKDGIFWLVCSLAFIGGSLIAALPFGAYHNVAMPALAMLSVLFGLAFHALTTCVETGHEGKENPLFKVCEQLIFFLALVQFFALLYNPLKLSPGEKDAAAGQELVQRLKMMEGEVLIPSHSYLLRLAGKPGCAHFLALEDALRDQRMQSGINLRKTITNAIAAKKYQTIILDEPWFLPEILRHYESRGPVFDDPSVFWPMTGYRTRPAEIYRWVATHPKF